MDQQPRYTIWRRNVYFTDLCSLLTCLQRLRHRVETTSNYNDTNWWCYHIDLALLAVMFSLFVLCIVHSVLLMSQTLCPCYKAICGLYIALQGYVCVSITVHCVTELSMSPQSCTLFELFTCMCSHYWYFCNKHCFICTCVYRLLNTRCSFLLH